MAAIHKSPLQFQEQELGHGMPASDRELNSNFNTVATHPLEPSMTTMGISHSQPSTTQQQQHQHQHHPQGTAHPVRIPGLGLDIQIESMETFEATMAQRAREAKDREREQETIVRRPNTPRPSKSKKQKTSNTSSSSTEPILLPPKAKTQWVAKLNHLLQVHDLNCVYDVQEALPHSFSATLTIHGNGAGNGGSDDNGESAKVFRMGNELSKSKKEAKERVALLGLQYLETLEITPRNRITAPTAQENGVDKSENWMGILNHFCQSNAVETPVFKEFQSGTEARFSCTCSFTLPPRLGFDLGEGDVEGGNAKEKVFGDAQDYYPNKKSAKVVVAREIVMWLREQGILPSQTSPLISKKTTVSASESASSSDEHNPSKPKDSEQGVSAATTTTTTTKSTTEKITSLCKELGLPTPIYQTHKIENTDNLYNMWVSFPGGSGGGGGVVPARSTER